MQKGFSLVELSIVLVILGLLTGGILAGQSLIRAAELRAISTEYSNYQTAVGTFRDKYFALPGDMTNAQSFWTAAATCPGDSSTPSTTPATCNGNGNGTLQQNLAGTNELFRFWQHLANAGLINGTYTGVSDFTTAGSAYTNPGLNVPRSKINNSGWTALSIGTIDSTSTTYFDGEYGNALTFGTVYPGGATRAPALKPEEAWNIDTKLDDGLPALGKVTSIEGYGGPGANMCTDLVASNAAPLPNSAYGLTRSGINCPLVFKNVF